MDRLHHLVDPESRSAVVAAQDTLREQPLGLRPPGGGRLHARTGDAVTTDRDTGSRPHPSGLATDSAGAGGPRPPAAPTGLVTGAVARVDRRTAGDHLRRGLRATDRTTATAHHTRPQQTPGAHGRCARRLWSDLRGRPHRLTRARQRTPGAPHHGCTTAGRAVPPLPGGRPRSWTWTWTLSRRSSRPAGRRRCGGGEGPSHCRRPASATSCSSRPRSSPSVACSAPTS